MKIIGLTGFAKSGKSTAAEVLKKLGGKEVAFAKHLKDVCSIVFDIQRVYFDDQLFKEVPFHEPKEVSMRNIKQILHFFEVEPRYWPAAILAHEGVKLTSPRHVAQYIGTELLRSIDPDIHIKMAFKLNQTKDGFLICSDVRFQNELEAVRNAGGIILGISRKAATPANLETLHPSEKEIPTLISKSTSQVDNEGTIEDFAKFVAHVSDAYLRP